MYYEHLGMTTSAPTRQLVCRTRGKQNMSFANVMFVLSTLKNRPITFLTDSDALVRTQRKHPDRGSMRCGSAQSCVEPEQVSQLQR
jgi:hypothetical protein